MKGLTIQQPFAWAVFSAKPKRKDIENRSWDTNHRGWIAIHAGANRTHTGNAWEWMKEEYGVTNCPKADEFVYGAILGVALLDDVIDESDSIWYQELSYGLVFSKVKKLAEPIPYVGQLGLWNVKPSVVKEMERQLGMKFDV